jgi:hypothetical protein
MRAGLGQKIETVGLDGSTWFSNHVWRAGPKTDRASSNLGRTGPGGPFGHLYAQPRGHISRSPPLQHPTQRRRHRSFHGELLRRALAPALCSFLRQAIKPAPVAPLSSTGRPPHIPVMGTVPPPLRWVRTGSPAHANTSIQHCCANGSGQGGSPVSS